MLDAAQLRAFSAYIGALHSTLSGGYASEGSHYPALKILLESLAAGIRVTILPTRISDVAPDFVVTEGSITRGYVEAKDIGRSLDQAENSEQLKRYLPGLSNLVLTDYLEFRWYVDGECRLKARLGTPAGDGKVKQDRAGTQQVAHLLISFLSHRADMVGTPKELAVRMARQAHLIRNLIISAFEKEPDGGSLHSQLAAFRDNLIPDLSVEHFSDMYAQTIAYGLFAARCISENRAPFTRLDAAQNLPRTNPFLRKLFQYIAGYELDDRIAWLVDDLAQLLAQANMEAVLRDFGKRAAREDPVVHFYETFLKEYDPKVREMRGVYYTPEPVVCYIVRSVDYLLKTRFGRPPGLADPTTLILDPAVGTATFLYMVVNEIHDAIVAQGQQGLWNDYVAEKLLPRLFGFELLMAPYAVAHLKLGLLLQETGYRFTSDQRVGIYLTNTLDEAFRRSEQLAGFNEYIVEEANTAAAIKNVKPVMVVLGNPPYSGVSANASVHTVVDPKTGRQKQELTWIGKLIEDYKVIDGQPLGERKHWLQDDYVKFIRFGQWRVGETGHGILALITNHGYIDNPTFRGMRQSLMNAFTDIYILNLHGSVKRKETCPDGNRDENVFDIQQGVAIGIFIKETGEGPSSKIHYADLWGDREGKHEFLSGKGIHDTEWMELTPTSPFYFFGPYEDKLKPEYEKCFKATEIFAVNSIGIQTSRDDLVVDFSDRILAQRMIDFADASSSDDDIRVKYFSKKKSAKYPPGDTRGWKLEKARRVLQKEHDPSSHIRPCLYRPFDIRSMYYTPDMVDWPRLEVMRHMLKNNIGLLVPRQLAILDYQHVLCTRYIAEMCVVSTNTKEQNYLFPLYLYPNEGGMQFEDGARRPNLNPEFVQTLSEKLGLAFIEDGKGDLQHTFGPQDIFDYVYAVLHSPTFRTRYAAFLRVDFARVPLASDRELFRALGDKGAALVALHLMESPLLSIPVTKYPVVGSNTVENVEYNENSQRVCINKAQYFEGVPPEVWSFHIGGYQVCQKWLKDRRGRTLNYDELAHYQNVIVALKETIRLMAEIDELIPGWPLE